MTQLTIQQAYDLAFREHQAGHLQEAERLYRQILAQQPGHAGCLHLLGVLAHQTGRHDEAADLIRQALVLLPHYADARSNLALALRARGQLEEAVAELRRAVALKPNYPEAFNNLGVTLRNLGRYDEALAALQQAIALRRDYPEAYNNVGIALWDKGQLDDAVAAFRQAIALKSTYVEAYNNLGSALKDRGDTQEAIRFFRQAITFNPQYPEARSNLILTMGYDPAYDAAAIGGELQEWYRVLAEPRKIHIRQHPNDRNPERRLRIGYVSADFWNHPVGRFLLPVLSHHDRDQVEIFGYSQVLAADELTERLRSHTDQWRNIPGLPDDQVDHMIREDRIDILVDLALHTAGNRLLVFARKPAPVQVTFAGYPGSTGLPAIDYRLTDPYLDPPGGDDRWCAEKTYRLPHSFWCFDPQTEEPAVSPLPALRNGFVTFGCLNNFCKVNEPTLENWARVLMKVGGSRLALLAKEGSHRQRAIDFLAERGVSAERVRFHSPRSRPEYLAFYHEVDLGLDTTPYNGHTTSLDSFWMGVPVVTLVGRTVVGRAGLSQLTNLGLPELAASAPEEFVTLAAGLAGNLARLQELRGGLRQRMKASPLMDGPRFARGMEAAYRDMWRKWCATAG